MVRVFVLYGVELCVEYFRQVPVVQLCGVVLVV